MNSPSPNKSFSPIKNNNNSNYKKKNESFVTFKKYCYNKLYLSHNTTASDYNRFLITNIIYNDQLHIVSCFKEFLIYYDPGEFLINYYCLKDCKSKIKTFSEFYSLNSRIFPNYVILPESQYIFYNIKKKQKMLDNMEENKNNANISYNNQKHIANSDINSVNFDKDTSSYSAIFTPSIMNSIVNDNNEETKTTNKSNMSSVNHIIDVLNNYTIDDNKKINESDYKKKSISSVDLLSLEKKHAKDNAKDNFSNSKKNPVDKKVLDTEMSNHKNKIFMHNSKKTQTQHSIHTQNHHNPKTKQKSFNTKNSNHKKNYNYNPSNIRNNDTTLNNKISLLLNTNYDTKLLKHNMKLNNNKNKQNNNLQKYIQHITSISNKCINLCGGANVASLKNYKIMFKKSTINKVNTTYSNKTQSQPSISYRHKKTSTIAKSMPKLPTSFEKNAKFRPEPQIFSVKGTNEKRKNLRNHIGNHSGGLHNFGGLCNINQLYNKGKRKFSKKNKNRKNSIKFQKSIKNQSFNNFYQTIKNNINNNINYNINHIKKNSNNNFYNNNNNNNAANNINKNINTNNSNKINNNIIPSLHINLVNFLNNNNTFLKCCSKSISKSKSKSNSKNKSVNKSNSFIKIIDDKKKESNNNNNNINPQQTILQIQQQPSNISSNNANSQQKCKMDFKNNIHKNIEGIQTERIKNNVFLNKKINLYKNTTNSNLLNNNNVNNKNIYFIDYNNFNLNKNKNKNKKNNYNISNNLNNIKQLNIKNQSSSLCENNKKNPKSARNCDNNKNIISPNTNNTNSKKNDNISEPVIINHQLKSSTHRILSSCENNLGVDNPKRIFSEKNKNIYLIHHYNINNVNNNINCFSQQNIKSYFNNTLSGRHNSIGQSQGTNIIININNNIFENKNAVGNFLYNNGCMINGTPSVNNNNIMNNKKSFNKIISNNKGTTKNTKTKK